MTSHKTEESTQIKRRKPKVLSIWTTDTVYDLILAVKEQPCLWEYSSLEYKDIAKREKAWYNVMEKCPGHLMDDCKAKWANLKTAYQNVIKKMDNKTIVGKPRWPFWHAMQFFQKEKNPTEIVKEDSPVMRLESPMLKTETPEKELDTCDDDSMERIKTPPPRKKRRRPHVLTMWTTDSIFKLIRSVKEQPCLWQYSSLEYKEKIKREQAWRMVMKKCPGHQVDDCKAKWANLKTAYMSAYKKQKTSKHLPEREKPQWPFWNAMRFTSTNDRSCSISSSETLAREDSPDSRLDSLIPKSETPEVNFRFSNTVMKEATNSLHTETDNWNALGMYLASQIRELAKTNPDAANKLHCQLLKTTINALEDIKR